MRRQLLLCSAASIAITTALSGPLKAGDMAVKGRAAAVAPAYPDWSGFYLGGHQGQGWSRFQGDEMVGRAVAAENQRVNSLKPSGLALGFHTGYNVQVGQWVYGIEGDATATPGWVKNNGSLGPLNGTGAGAGVDWLASIRGRLGWVFDRSLIYATGGVAWSKTYSFVRANDSFVHEARKVKTGAVFGGGIEWKYNPHFSLRLEGLHYLFNDKNNLTADGDSHVCTGCGVKNITVIRVGATWHPQPYNEAFAADLGSIGKARPRLAAPTWSGPYLGGHVGYGWSRFRAGNEFADGGIAEDNERVDSLKPSGLALGLHTGYNWQVGQWVYGIEGDATVTPGWAKNNGALGPLNDTGAGAGVDWLASIRGRLGWVFDRSLIYATGGVAWAKTSTFVRQDDSFVHEARKVKTGAVLGGGIEWKYNPNLSLRLEGLHYFFNDKNTLNAGQPGGGGHHICTDCGLKSATVIRAGASWHLDGGADMPEWARAMAADMPVKGRAVAPAYTGWSGPYLGGHIGYGWSRFRAGNEFADGGIAEENERVDSLKPSGLAIGAQTGYNWQVGQWVYGIESDATVTPGWVKNNGALGPLNDTGAGAGVDWLASIRGRLGWAFDRTLIYATGGVAWAKTSTFVRQDDSFVHESRKVKVGAVFGGGIEWKYNPKISFRLEGLHYLFNEKNNLNANDDHLCFDCGLKNATVIRAGASWHFDGQWPWGKGPVAAKY